MDRYFIHECQSCQVPGRRRRHISINIHSVWTGYILTIHRNISHLRWRDDESSRFTQFFLKNVSDIQRKAHMRGGETSVGEKEKGVFRIPMHSNL